MTQLNSGGQETANEPSLPRRDWVLLPLIGMLTVVFLAFLVLSTTSRLNPSSMTDLDRCFVKDDPSGDARPIPNSVCWERTAESRFLAEYKFNSCGHRAGMECGPKPPGTYRIVMIGSSMAMGLFVPREMTFAALLPAELSARTGRKIEIYNEATGGKFRGGSFPTSASAHRFGEVLSEDPDMILWIVTPADIKNVSSETFHQGASVAVPDAFPTSVRRNVAGKASSAIVSGSFFSKLHARWDQTAAATALEHLLYESESHNQYVKSYVKDEDNSGYLKSEPDAHWQNRFDLFQARATEFEKQAGAAGVPLVVALVPDRAQTVMISMGEWPAGYDPYKLDDEVRAIIQSQGGICIDILPDFHSVPNPERYYSPVDGHPDADGDAIIAEFLAKELTSGAVPALEVAQAPATALAKGQ
jgi:hypothetical protein